MAEYLIEARESSAPKPSDATWPKALIVPHAGYMYSGLVAARAYATLEPGADIVERIILIGPSHHVPFEGIALPSNAAFETPLGLVHEDACGRTGVQALLGAARECSLSPQTLDLRSSGDTAGGRDEVVGYGAWAFTASRNGSP